jgi:glycosyltransferase involved in cell wall biosynthesis
MMSKTSILYIGNNLSRRTKYITTIDSLSKLLRLEGYLVYTSSKKKSKLLRLIDMCFSVIKLKNKIDYILIDTYSTSSFIYAYCVSQLARLFKIKYIPILHGGNLPDRLKKNPKICSHVFNYSYRNVTPSNYLKHEFLLKGIETILIPNSIEIEKYHFKERVVIKPHLLFVRALAEIYNPKMAIQVLAQLKEKYTNAKLCVIGPDKDGSLEKVKKYAIEKGVISDVEFTGILTKSDWHKKSEDFDIFINTTNIDNTPVSVIEAMALGLPIVSTNVGGLPYLIDQNVNGILVEKGNVNQMCVAIEGILEGKHSVMAKNARKMAELFQWQVVKEKWIKVLQ